MILVLKMLTQYDFLIILKNMKYFSKYEIFFKNVCFVIFWRNFLVGFVLVVDF
jgi:hypothetical protein